MVGQSDDPSSDGVLRLQDLVQVCNLLNTRDVGFTWPPLKWARYA